MANMFNEDGTYNKTEWKAGDKITAVKLNKIESSLEAINNNDIDRHVEADNRLDILEERMVNTPDNEQMDALEDMVKDNKDAADLALYSINQKIESLESVNADSRLDILEEGLDSVTNEIYYINPKKFDNDIQATIEYAHAHNIKYVKLDGMEYTLKDTLYVYSNMILEGVEGVTTLKLKNVDGPVIASKGSLLGGTHIKNLNVVGDKSQSNNHGIFLNNYYSSIKNCTALYCGGYGFCLSDIGASGTLVENRIENCIARECVGTSFYLGPESNKITDGYLINCISHGSGSNKALHVGAGAGWNINGLHTYGHGNCRSPIEILNSFNTTVSNVYVEDFNGVCFNCSKVQMALNLSNITINFKAGLTDSVGFYFNHSTSFDQISTINLSNLSINSGGGLSSCSIYGGDDSHYKVNIVNTNISGSTDGLSLIKNGLSKERHTFINNCRITEGIQLTKVLNDTYRGVPVYGGYRIPLYKSGSISGTSNQQTEIGRAHV